MTSEKLESITADKFRAFIANKVPESRSIEYKELLPANLDKEKKEFLADVSSLANAGGGDLYVGVTAERDANGQTTGRPDSAVGVAIGTTTDAELLRINAILRDGLDPRLPRVESRFVDGFPRGSLLIIRVGQSWATPHMVKFAGSSRFWSRSSNGKFQLDVREIRAAFLASEAISERMSAFREKRVSMLLSGQSPMGRAHQKMFVLHVLPVTAFDRSSQPIPYLARLRECEPLHLTNFPFGVKAARYNLEGFLVSSAAVDMERKVLPYAQNYVQIFRSGAFEAVSSLDQIETFKDWFPEHMAEQLCDYFAHYLEALRGLNVPLPLVVFVSLLGTKGTKLNISEHKIPVDMRAASNCTYHPIESDAVFLPDALVEDYAEDAQALLRPILDALYQACGFPKYFRVA